MTDGYHWFHRAGQIYIDTLVIAFREGLCSNGIGRNHAKDRALDNLAVGGFEGISKGQRTQSGRFKQRWVVWEGLINLPGWTHYERGTVACQ